MRLQGSIFIPSQCFLIRFALFTRKFIIFVPVTWADFIWNPEFKLCPLHLYFTVGNKQTDKKNLSKRYYGKKKKKKKQ